MEAWEHLAIVEVAQVHSEDKSGWRKRDAKSWWQKREKGKEKIKIYGMRFKFFFYR